MAGGTHTVNLESTAATTRLPGHFERGDKIVYLSRLGNESGRDRLILEKLTGTKLTQFVRENFRWEVHATGQHNSTVYKTAGRCKSNLAQQFGLQRMNV